MILAGLSMMVIRTQRLMMLSHGYIYRNRIEVSRMIQIDIPQIAYKTWNIGYIVEKDDGTRNRDLEWEFENDLQKSLSEYKYSDEHDHVR